MARRRSEITVMLRIRREAAATVKLKAMPFQICVEWQLSELCSLDVCVYV